MIAGSFNPVVEGLRGNTVAEGLAWTHSLFGSSDRMGQAGSPPAAHFADAGSVGLRWSAAHSGLSVEEPRRLLGSRVLLDLTEDRIREYVKAEGPSTWRY